MLMLVLLSLLRMLMLCLVLLLLRGQQGAQAHDFLLICDSALRDVVLQALQLLFCYQGSGLASYCLPLQVQLCVQCELLHNKSC